MPTAVPSPLFSLHPPLFLFLLSLSIRLTGALMGIASHFSGFFSEMLAVAIAASALACWRVSVSLVPRPSGNEC